MRDRRPGAGTGSGRAPLGCQAERETEAVMREARALTLCCRKHRDSAPWWVEPRGRGGAL